MREQTLIWTLEIVWIVATKSQVLVFFFCGVGLSMANSKRTRGGCDSEVSEVIVREGRRNPFFKKKKKKNCVSVPFLNSFFLLLIVVACCGARQLWGASISMVDMTLLHFFCHSHPLFPRRTYHIRLPFPPCALFLSPSSLTFPTFTPLSFIIIHPHHHSHINSFIHSFSFSSSSSCHPLRLLLSIVASPTIFHQINSRPSPYYPQVCSQLGCSLGYTTLVVRRLSPCTSPPNIYSSSSAAHPRTIELFDLTNTSTSIPVSTTQSFTSKPPPLLLLPSSRITSRPLNSAQHD